MSLKNTEVFIDLQSGSQPHTLTNLAVAFLALNLNHENFPLFKQEEQLLQTPGCRTENVFVSGVANTTRHLLLLVDPKHPLLGHNAGCLSGIKEVSPWTKVVEVTLPQSLSRTTSLSEVESAVTFLDELFEKPFIGHNQRKVRHEAIKLGVLPPNGILSHDEWAALPVLRRYIHGLHPGATDILIFGMLHATLLALGHCVRDLQVGKLLHKWIRRMEEVTQTAQNSPRWEEMVRSVKSWGSEKNTEVEMEEDKIADDKVEKVDKVDMIELEKSVRQLYDCVKYTDSPLSPVEWDSLSTLLKPQRHNANNTKKMDQLHSMLGGVQTCVAQLRAARTPSRIRIVDFCSGAGHLGIFIAHHFPDCEVVLVETKWGSLRYAKERIAGLGLNNVTLCLSHMGQFRGSFEVGISLHACGSATDAVIQQCISNNAALVSSPCCYGKIVNFSVVEYPQSKLIRGEVPKFPQFMEIARLADHESENEEYMKCVDIDRLEALRDKGYRFLEIRKLKPPTCSPKNNLLVAYR